MEGQEFLQYLRVLRKRWWLILMLMVSTVGTILIVLYTTKPRYQSSVKFLFSSPPVAEITVYGDFREPTVRDEIPSAKANFNEILGSEAVIWQAIEILGLDMRAKDVVLTVEPSENSEIVRLLVEMESPQLAADMANTLIDVALKTYGEVRAKPTTMSHAFISQQLESAYAEWMQAQDRLTQFQIENGTSNFHSALESQQILIRSLYLDRDRAMADGNLQKAARYDELIAKREAELQNWIWLSAQYAELETLCEQTYNVYDLLLMRETEAALKENEILNVGFVSVFAPAWPPEYPMSPFSPKLVVFGGIASLVVGAFLALGWEYLETHGAAEAAEPAGTDRHKLWESVS
jgi:uncharacterized protein involved in exopolysaccharide biosynthesis